MSNRTVPDNSANIQGKARATWPIILACGFYFGFGAWLILSEERWGSRDSGASMPILGLAVVGIIAGIVLLVHTFFNAWENLANARKRRKAKKDKRLVPVTQHQPVVWPPIVGVALIGFGVLLWSVFGHVFGNA